MLLKSQVFAHNHWAIFLVVAPPNGSLGSYSKSFGVFQAARDSCPSQDRGSALQAGCSFLRLGRAREALLGHGQHLLVPSLAGRGREATLDFARTGIQAGLNSSGSMVNQPHSQPRLC